MYLNFSIPPNEMALYPNWLILYGLRIVIPMLMLVLVALKILIKSGRDLQREFDIDLTPSIYNYCCSKKAKQIIYDFDENG